MRFRIATSLLGFWLALSIFVWPHHPNRGFSDLVVGLVLFLNAACGIWARGLRFFDGAMGLWIAASAFLIESGGRLERVHDLLLGLVVLGLASVRGRDLVGRFDHWISDFDLNPRLMRPFTPAPIDLLP